MKMLRKMWQTFIVEGAEKKVKENKEHMEHNLEERRKESFEYRLLLCTERKKWEENMYIKCVFPPL